MKREDKELLLRDLCARLPYEVKCNISRKNGTYVKSRTIDSILDCHWLCECKSDFYEIKPYLFPLSSMTEEIMDEIYNNTGVYDIGIDSPVHIEVGTTFEDLTKIINILYKHHIDINGLIPKGHAIDATGLNIY